MKTTEEFRNELYARFGTRLIIPDDAEYIGSKKDIKTICPKHGELWMRPNNLLNGSGCRCCGREVVRQKNSDTAEDFLSKARHEHGDKYEYPRLDEEYGKQEKITIHCCTCGKEFQQRPALHIFGNGCPHCRPFPKSYTQETLKLQIQKLHPNIELLDSHIGDNDTPITVRCVKHNTEWQTTPHRLSQQKYGCHQCYIEAHQDEIRDKQGNVFASFLEEHYQGRYDISQAEYINSETKVKLICPKHGEFWLTPNKMISRMDACPYCKESKMERSVAEWLTKQSIDFERQKAFEWLRDKGWMSLDFFLPQHNIAIECQGEQHIVKRDDSMMFRRESFEDKVERDKLKYRLCMEHNISVVYIIQRQNFQLIQEGAFGGIYQNVVIADDLASMENYLG